MAVTETNFTDDATNTQVGVLGKTRNDSSPDGIRIDAFGDFGGGTLTFSYSPDNGTTKISLKNGIGGSAISLTADESFAFTAPIYNGDKALILYATLSGSTSPDIDVRVCNPYEA